MTSEMQFAVWVTPIAAKYRDRRTELIKFARAMPVGSWSLPSPDEGWDCKDLLAHVAGDTGKNLHAGLRAIIAGDNLSPSLFTDTAERNAQDVRERRGRPVAELIAELEIDGAETQRLLAQLPGDAAEHRIDGLRGTLVEALDALAVHDSAHLEQLREVTKAGQRAAEART